MSTNPQPSHVPDLGALLVPVQFRPGHPGALPHPSELEDAEEARDRAMSRLRDAEHWRRLVAARLDLAVAAVADIDDLETTLVELRPLIGMPVDDGRLAESSLLIRLRAALGELDRLIVAAKSEVEDATTRVAACIVHETAAEPAPGALDARVF